MILCPVCLRSFVLEGKERSLYIAKYKAMKYGKPCSDDCHKKMINPMVIRTLKPVAHFIVEMPRTKRHDDLNVDEIEQLLQSMQAKS